MATVIPSLSTIRGMTPGERCLGQRLESLLEDDYTVWYDIPLGRQRRYPDYIILHPGQGCWALEMKERHRIDIFLKRVELHVQKISTITPPLIYTVVPCIYVSSRCAVFATVKGDLQSG